MRERRSKSDSKCLTCVMKKMDLPLSGGGDDSQSRESRFFREDLETLLDKSHLICLCL